MSLRLLTFQVAPALLPGILSCFLSISPFLRAQSPSTPSAPPASAVTSTTPAASEDQPAYTIHTGNRLVLTDVTVTDRAGTPVHGLPASAFRIFDGKVPQETVSFEEHTATASSERNLVAPIAAHPRGVYSNDFLLHPPPVLNVVLLDITNLALQDQMYLSYELNLFLKNLPAGETLAIYERAGDITVLLQNFTADRNLLLAAVHRGLPRFPPVGAIYLTDFQTLQQLATYVGDLPGRKNILWFSGGSTLFLQLDPLPLQDDAAARRIYDLLEADRIAIYPIDARGLTMAPHLGQHAIMDEIAEATGGHAFYNNNGLKESASRVLSSDGDFYTLTYSPRNYREDRKWHKVRVTLEGNPYTLSYRRGYFADGFNASLDHQGDRVGSHLLQDGSTGAAQFSRSASIIFEARVLPTSDPASIVPPSPTSVNGAQPQGKPKRNTIPYSIHYAIPVDDLTSTTTPAKQTIQILIAAFAFNQGGSIVDKSVHRVRLTIDTKKLEASPHAKVPFDLALQLAKGETSLMLAVVDESSGRSGNVQLALDVQTTPKSK